MHDSSEANTSEISIHPPREGWDALRVDALQLQLDISIHPPREGWDPPVRW